MFQILITTGSFIKNNKKIPSYILISLLQNNLFKLRRWPASEEVTSNSVCHAIELEDVSKRMYPDSLAG